MNLWSAHSQTMKSVTWSSLTVVAITMLMFEDAYWNKQHFLKCLTEMYRWNILHVASAEIILLIVVKNLYHIKLGQAHVTCTCHLIHYSDIIIGVMASQIASLMIVYSTVKSGADQRKYQSSASLAFVLGIQRWPVNSRHKGPVRWKMFPSDDVVMIIIKAKNDPIILIYVFINGDAP